MNSQGIQPIGTSPTSSDIGRVTIVTGAARGIGRAIAEQLAADGNQIVVNYRQSRDEASDVVAGIRERQGIAIDIQADVSIQEDRERLVEQTVRQWGRVDLLVNNAGVTSPGRKDLLEVDEASWDLVMATNLKGPFFLAQLVARQMIRQYEAENRSGGMIVNISSISAYAVSTNRVDYCVAKAGVQMLTWQLAVRLAEFDIRVYEICPGIVATDMTAGVKGKYDAKIAEGLTPIRRWGEPADVARAVSMLAAGSLPFSTGERINVDGGFHIRQL